jgi:aquaporin Z
VYSTCRLKSSKRKPWLISIGSKISLEVNLVSQQKSSRRVLGNLLARIWRMRQRCAGRCLSRVGYWFCRVALAFGLTVLTMAYAIGHISGCHLNPAISVGLVVGKRFSASDLPAYVVAQVAGAIAAAGVLYVIASGKAAFDLSSGFASNGYGTHSPGGYSLLACLVAEVVLTLFFLLVIMGSTDRRAPAGFAPIAIGLCLTLIHLIGIPVTNLSVNPARSTGPAIFVGGWALSQLWLFWIAPIVGGALGGGIYRAVFGEP